jgi:hypothetical protein
MSFARLFVLVIGGWSLCGCNNGSWVDAPKLCPFLQAMEQEKAQGKSDPEAEKITAELTKASGQEACGIAGKSWTGEYDCAEGKSRVRCN